MDIEDFVEKQVALIEIENRVEAARNLNLEDINAIQFLKEKGFFLRKLELSQSVFESYGSLMLVFKAANSSALPSNNISLGDLVTVVKVNGEGQWLAKTSGVVNKINSQIVSVACDKEMYHNDIEEEEHYNLLKLIADVTYKRIKRALLFLKHNRNMRRRDFTKVLFNHMRPSLRAETFAGLRFHNPFLNSDQQEAVRFAMRQREIAIIHGPPGTGKTTTIVEIVVQAVFHGQKVLVCAPSNVAVDNLVDRLSMINIKIIRLGHPARALPCSQIHSLDAVLSLLEEEKRINELNDEIRRMKEEKENFRRRIIQMEANRLFSAMNERKRCETSKVLIEADVILSTVASACRNGPLAVLSREGFDLVVIDECPQATEASCWIPLLFADKCVLAGDHHQLPPVIISDRAEKRGLGITLMERLIKMYGSKITKMLKIQYRMNEAIMKWPSERMYQGKLVAHSDVAAHLLRDIPGVQDNKDTNTPLILIDTAGCNLNEIQDDDSKGNEGEADLVSVHVKALIDSGVSAASIGVVTPYNMQVDLIKIRMGENYPGLEIKSVDGFQGREKEAIVLSLVRSNKEGKIGFLSEDRRINVAVTRARRHLAVVCDSETVSNHKFLKELMEYLREHGEVRSASLPIYQEAINTMDLYKTLVQQKKVHKERPNTCQRYIKWKREMTNNSYYRRSRRKRYRSRWKFPFRRTNNVQFPVQTTRWNDFSHGSQRYGDRWYNRIGRPPFHPPKSQYSSSKPRYHKTSQSGHCTVLQSAENPVMHLLPYGSSSSKDSCGTLGIGNQPSVKISKQAKEISKISKRKHEAGTDKLADAVSDAVRADDKCTFENCTKPVELSAEWRQFFSADGICDMIQLCKFCGNQYCCIHLTPRVHCCQYAPESEAKKIKLALGSDVRGDGSCNLQNVNQPENYLEYSDSGREPVLKSSLEFGPSGEMYAKAIKSKDNSEPTGVLDHHKSQRDGVGPHKQGLVKKEGKVDSKEAQALSSHGLHGIDATMSPSESSVINCNRKENSSINTFSASDSVDKTCKSEVVKQNKETRRKDKDLPCVGNIADVFSVAINSTDRCAFRECKNIITVEPESGQISYFSCIGLSLLFQICTTCKVQYCFDHSSHEVHSCKPAGKG